MTSGAMSGCDFLAIPQVQHSEDSGVWRYVMEAGFGAEGILDISCLEILEKDDGYLSFYHSDRMPKSDFISKVKHIHKLISLTKTNPAIYLNFDVIEAKESTENRTYFFDAGYPHIGMYYPEESDLNSLELRTILVEISEVYQRAYGGVVTKIL